MSDLSEQEGIKFVNLIYHHQIEDDIQRDSMQVFTMTTIALLFIYLLFILCVHVESMPQCPCDSKRTP